MKTSKQSSTKSIVNVPFDAKIARMMVEDAALGKDAEREIRIRQMVNEMLEVIAQLAKGGTSQMLFAPKNPRYTSDIDEVRLRMQKLGFRLYEESDMGMRYEMISW